MAYKKYKCKTCGLVYDEALGDVKRGIPAGTLWADLAEDWECPGCGACKAMFREIK